MWLLSVPVSPGQAQASAFCLPSFVSGVAQSPIYWAASWIYLVSPLSTPQLVFTWGWGDLYCESSVHIHNDFLGTNHVFHLCTFYISIKMEMENCPPG